MQATAMGAPALQRDGGALRSLYRNWRGSVAGATSSSSGSTDDATVWPAVNDVCYAPDARQSAPEPNKWMGSLVTDGRDATGTLYRRNRYYDPVSGRFTQEDPIGVAGGVNLYGYGDGDPVNNSDPFGLCPEKRTGRPCTWKDILSLDFSIGFQIGASIELSPSIGGDFVFSPGPVYTASYSARGVSRSVDDGGSAAVGLSALGGAATVSVRGDLQEGGSVDARFLGSDPLQVDSRVPGTAAKLGLRAILGVDLAVNWGAIKEVTTRALSPKDQ